MNAGTLRLATRGSMLAKRQAAIVTEALEARRHDVELLEVETTGDRVSDELIHRLGKTGAFVRSLDEQVLEGAADAAVHSMKDMPTDSPEELIVAAIPQRADAGDVLLTPDGSGLEELPTGATVGTSSLRRGAQLKTERDDLRIESLRGNVDTRIEKLLAPSLQREHERRLEAATADESDGSDAPESTTEDPDQRSSTDVEQGGETGEEPPTEFERSVETWFDALSEIERRALERRPDTEYDAIVLAGAGLERAGLAGSVDTEPLPTSSFVPAPGQGAIAVTAIAGSDASEVCNDAIDHPRTRVETTVERIVLAELGGGCVAPIGVYAVVKGEYVHVDAAVFDREGQHSVEGHRNLPAEDYVESARAFAGDLRDRGAADLIAEARVPEETREAKRE